MALKHTRTFRLDKLYNQFLKPKNIPLEQLPFLISKLYEAGFITVVRDSQDPDLERYSETEKLTSRQHRDELFKIIERLKT
jgi:DNA-binding transcriptional ArsR family regulator